jgi:hypothetical protein
MPTLCPVPAAKRGFLLDRIFLWNKTSEGRRIMAVGYCRITEVSFQYWKCADPVGSAHYPAFLQILFILISLFRALWFKLCIYGPGSSVGISTGYRLDGPGIEFRRGRDFAHTSRPSPPSLLYNGYRVFPGGKATGAWCWPLTPS